jgi:hypothetical protein
VGIFGKKRENVINIFCKIKEVVQRGEVEEVTFDLTS